MISWTNLLTSSKPHNSPRYLGFNGRPKVVVWNITSSCNLYCRHCYFMARREPGPKELSSDEARNFIEDLVKLEVPALIFSGGEPLLRKDIFSLAKLAQDKGTRVALSTNGTLITEEVAKKIKRAGFYYCGISLDGREQTHDIFRKRRGAFALALSAIKNCQKFGLKVGIRFTLTRYNFKDLPNIFELVEKENIPRLCIYHLVYTGRGSRLREQDLSHQEKREVLEIIWQKTQDFSQKGLPTEILTVDNHADGVWIYLKLKKRNQQAASRVFNFLKSQGGNTSGQNLAAVDNCGNIYPDQFWRTYSLGNIRKDKFSHIWQDKHNLLLERLRNRKSLLKGRCQRCGFLELCNGNLRARSEAVFADPWQEDPACYLTKEEICN